MMARYLNISTDIFKLRIENNILSVDLNNLDDNMIDIIYVDLYRECMRIYLNQTIKNYCYNLQPQFEEMPEFMK